MGVKKSHNCRCRDLIRGSLVSEATALPTAPRPATTTAPKIPGLPPAWAPFKKEADSDYRFSVIVPLAPNKASVSKSMSCSSSVFKVL